MTSVLPTRDDTTGTTRALVRYLDAIEGRVTGAIRDAATHAIKRNGGDASLSGDGLYNVSTALAGPLAVSTLLGRQQIQLALADAQAQNEFDSFNEPDSILGYTIEQLTKLLTPQSALDYFRRLIPIKLGEQLFGAIISGQAFQLAATTDHTLRKMVAKVVAERLETGKSVGAGAREIEEILDEAGVTHKAGYGAMTLRTNMMESYRRGSWDEFNSPNVVAYFPVWKYSGIDDGRQRMGPMPQKPDHDRWFGKYFDRAVNFFQVRGMAARDVINCRCVFIPKNKFAWAKLQKQGVKVEPWPQ